LGVSAVSRLRVIFGGSWGGGGGGVQEGGSCIVIYVSSSVLTYSIGGCCVVCGWDWRGGGELICGWGGGEVKAGPLGHGPVVWVGRGR